MNYELTNKACLKLQRKIDKDIKEMSYAYALGRVEGLLRGLINNCPGIAELIDSTIQDSDIEYTPVSDKDI
jgi:hypothetical protein